MLTKLRELSRQNGEMSVDKTQMGMLTKLRQV